MTKPKVVAPVAPAKSVERSFFDTFGDALGEVFGLSSPPEAVPADASQSPTVPVPAGESPAGEPPAKPQRVVLEIKHLFEPVSRTKLPTAPKAPEGETPGDDEAEAGE